MRPQCVPSLDEAADSGASARPASLNYIKIPIPSTANPLEASDGGHMIWPITPSWPLSAKLERQAR